MCQCSYPLSLKNESISVYLRVRLTLFVFASSSPLCAFVCLFCLSCILILDIDKCKLHKNMITFEITVSYSENNWDSLFFFFFE